METSQKPQNQLIHAKDDKVSQECRDLISSLPLHQSARGINLCNYQGCWYYYNTLQAVLDFKKHFQPKDTDIFVASFPKSGTTWLKALTFAVLGRGKYRSDHANHPLLTRNPHSLVPFLELRLYLETRVPDLTGFSSPRLFATHIPFHTLHETLKDTPCKIVYVCRNLKDTVVSGWHFMSRSQNREPQISTLEAVVNSFCRGVHLYGPFWDHVLSYWRESLENPKHVLFMKYEEMKKDPRAEIKRLAEFLDCPFTEEEEQSGLVDEILELCSLQSLSNLDVNKTGKTAVGIDHSAHFRKGEVGDWMNHLSPDMVERIDETIEVKLRGSGLKFE